MNMQIVEEVIVKNECIIYFTTQWQVSEDGTIVDFKKQSKTIVNMLPPLYSKDKLERICEWRVFTYNNKIYRNSGIMGEKYKVRTYPPIYVTKKNVGRKNETSLFEQSLFEAKSKWNKQVAKGYKENIYELNSASMLPILAHKYVGKGLKYLKLPFGASKKMDGVRCITHIDNNGNVDMISRLGNSFNNMNEIRKDFKKMVGDTGYIFDGELYNHDIPFNKISGSVRKKSKVSNIDSKIYYYVFDMIDTKLTYFERVKILKEFERKSPKSCKIRFELYEVVNDHSEVKGFLSKYVAEGYEGLMLRNLDGMYINKRSNDLLKYKLFDDSEFKIIGGKEGTVTAAGAVVFECVTKEGKIFDVFPRGSMERRRRLFTELPNIIGKMLTVRYQGLDPVSNIPRFPIGIGVRDYE